MMMARGIGSLIWTSIKGSTKLLTKLYLTLRRSRGLVKKGRQVFYESLREFGIPQDVAKSISKTYAHSGLELLKIRRVIRLAREMGAY